MIAAWPCLASWIQSHRVDEQRRRRLEVAAAQWVEHGRGARGLLDPIELAEAASWQQTESALQLGSSTEVSDLIAASRAAQVKQRRRRRLLLGSAFAALAAVAVVVAVLAITAQESANDAHREADNAHQRLVQLHLGLGRQLLASDHPDRAVPYLLAARESRIEDVLLRALFRWATQYLPIQRLVHHGFVSPPTSRAWYAVRGMATSPTSVVSGRELERIVVRSTGRVVDRRRVVGMARTISVIRR